MCGRARFALLAWAYLAREGAAIMADTRMQADVVVVGAGAGGLTAAAYLAQLGRHVVVVDRGAGAEVLPSLQ